MDKEFHYYITYLVAARAGYSATDAETIAYASQFVDDNTDEWTVTGPMGGPPYSNRFSQSLHAHDVVNVHRDRDLYPVYMAFHFVPGDPARESAWRRDGQMHLLNTTPNSLFARILLKHALKTENLYRIGIAAHAYADTWAHQNFSGTWNPFNSKKGGTVFCIGHGEFGHGPDPPGLVWTDPRLVDHQQKVNNTERCLLAAKHLFHHFWMDRPPGQREDSEKDAIRGLSRHLCEAIQNPEGQPHPRDVREKNYKARALGHHYQVSPLPDYSKEKWFNDSILQTGAGTGVWKEPADYRGTSWFKFQEAVKKHFDLAWSLFSADIEDRMNLKTPRAD